MKIRLLFSFIIFLVFFSCKEDEISGDKGNQIDISDSTPGTDKIYINVGLNNGETLITSRADDGTGTPPSYEELEKTVLNGKIFIYEAGNDEATAVCVSQGDLVNPIDGTPNEDIVVKTVHYNNIALDMFDYDESKTYYALVIINPFNDFVLPEINQKFGDWASTPQTGLMTQSYRIYHNRTDLTHHLKYITMANATGDMNPEDGEFNPMTLVKINNYDISRIPFADNKVATTKIYVQRNVAKVVLVTHDELDGTKKLVNIGTSALIQMNVYNFMLDVINKSSYPVQYIEGLNWDRDFSHSGNSSFDQVYWAIDPNYDDTSKSKNNGDFSSSELPPSNGAGNPLYCLENTFNVDNMIQGQTTRVVVRCSLDWWGKDATEERNEKITFSSEDYFYDIDGVVPTKEKYPPINGKAQNLKSKVVGNDFGTNGFYTIGEYENKTFWDLKHIIKAIQDKAAELSIASPSVSLKEELQNDAKGGYYTLKELLSITPDPSSEEWTAYAEALGIENLETEKIGYYRNCWAYYPIRIRHFSDEDEGIYWNGSSRLKESDGLTRIANYNEGHLGRYGVLRNNEYEIVINSISGLGSPEQYPEITDDDTDDMPDKLLMEVTINVKHWNKRKVSFDF